MEVTKLTNMITKLVRTVSWIAVFTLPHYYIQAQSTGATYTVKKGRMYIELGRQVSDKSLDSFIAQYDLEKLELKKFVQNNFPDSLVKQGWTLEKSNPNFLTISKPMTSLDNLNEPAEKIAFTERRLASFAELFPPVSGNVKYGYNSFRNKRPFAIRDSTVTFYLRDYITANHVMLAGSFNNWDPAALSMKKTDSGWIANVELAAGKYWYKFVVDGRWITDRDNPVSENDGLGNTNSVFFKPNHVFRVAAFRNAKKVYLAGSFNNWRPRELLMYETTAGWELPLYLADGTHTYRYVADGHWFADPGNSESYPNEFNDVNSVVRIGKPYLFLLDGYTDAKQVVLSGTFNNWRKDELLMKKTGKGWELPYTLGPGNYQYKFLVDNKLISRPDADKNSGNSYFVIGANYTFRLKGFENAKKVYLAGDFNEWSPDTFSMQRAGDEWIFKVHLHPGKHLYKFIVDGKWILDPGNKLWEQNEHNTGNSVVWIDKNPVM